jgi:hypothetical protein
MMTVSASAWADGESEEIAIQPDYEAPAFLENLSDVNIDEELVIDGVSISLYPTFDNSITAMEKIQDNCSNILSLLQTTYGLDDLSSNNWHDYMDCMVSYLYNPMKASWYSETHPQYAQLSMFFDIYENDEKNEEIEEAASNCTSIEDLLANDELYTSLPSSNGLEISNSNAIISPEQYIDSDGVGLSSLSSTSFSAWQGTLYAEQYYSYANSNYKDFENNDCTNFVSQILHAGGQSMNLTWYHNKVLGLWTYSPTWTVATNFINYWDNQGATFLTTSTHATFAINLANGTFITYDKTNDGDWEHMGYVTDTESYSASLGYADYKVAQHSGKYNSWASGSINGWDTLTSSYPSLKYGLLRF